jgi:hypothetical protein
MSAKSFENPRDRLVFRGFNPERKENGGEGIRVRGERERRKGKGERRK